MRHTRTSTRSRRSILIITIMIAIGLPAARTTAIDPPTFAPPPHDFLKNRYISIDPSGGGLNVGFPFDIKVTLSATEVSGVTAIGSVYWAHAPDADCVSVVTPFPPTAMPTWDACPILHVTGCPIIPTSTYDITVFDGAMESVPLVANTQARPGIKWWGDCVGTFDPIADSWTPPQGFVNFDDISAVTQTFQDPTAVPGCGTPPCTAVHLSVADLHAVGPAHPDKVVTLGDVCAVISGFTGEEYPGPALEQCPPIHSTPCQCNGDVDDSGSLNINDVFIMTTCVSSGDCSGCGHFCDVNCDGMIDIADVETVVCLVDLNPPATCCGLKAPQEEPHPVDELCCGRFGCGTASTCDDGSCPNPKNRYLSVEPNNPGVATRLEVILTSSLPHPGSAGDSWWVMAPVLPGNPLLPAGECVATLGPEANAAEIDWDAAGCQTLHITGCPVMPTGNYHVQASAGLSVSSLLSLPTAEQPQGGKWWGDIVGAFLGGEWTPPQGTVNIDDVSAAIFTWQGGPVVAPTGNIAHLSVADVEPGNINKVVNFADVQRLLLAFTAEMYPFGPPDADGDCP